VNKTGYPHPERGEVHGGGKEVFCRNAWGEKKKVGYLVPDEEREGEPLIRGRKKPGKWGNEKVRRGRGFMGSNRQSRNGSRGGVWRKKNTRLEAKKRKKGRNFEAGIRGGSSKIFWGKKTKRNK